MRSYPDTDIDPIFIAINMKSSVGLLLEVYMNSLRQRIKKKYIWIRQNKLRRQLRPNEMS